VDLGRFARDDGGPAKARALLGMPGSGPTVGAVGRLVEQKGHRFLLRAMAVVLRAHPAGQLVIIGEGPLQARLEAEASLLGIADSVRFLGARPDVERLLPALDVLVSASLWEGLSIVILEALAAGVPVVATDVSGSREALTDGLGTCGLIVRPGDAEGLARAVLALLDDGDLRESLRVAGLARVRQFDIAIASRQYAALYRQMAPHGR
jgi:glycosyltransferase involved in cell wall biosynthesis